MAGTQLAPAKVEDEVPKPPLMKNIRRCQGIPAARRRFTHEWSRTNGIHRRNTSRQ